MPKQTIYIRDEDLDKWKNLKEKSTRIHEMLNGIPYTPQPLVAPQQPEQPVLTEEQPCCHNRIPCNHWLWDGIKGTYTNSISGRIVEVTA